MMRFRTPKNRRSAAGSCPFFRAPAWGLFDARPANSMDSANGQPATTATIPTDRRQYSRCTLQIPVDLRQEDSVDFQHLETTDLSRGGCYVRLLHPLALATYVQVTLWLQNSPVRVRGRVVTRHPQYGNGIMFLELEGTGEQLLSSYLDAIPV